MTPDPEKIRFFEARAPAYDRLCRRWEIFPQLSNRLIDLLPADLQGPVLDIGAGSRSRNCIEAEASAATT